MMARSDSQEEVDRVSNALKNTSAFLVRTENHSISLLVEDNKSSTLSHKCSLSVPPILTAQPLSPEGKMIVRGSP
jgi:hypothetical protein